MSHKTDDPQPPDPPRGGGIPPAPHVGDIITAYHAGYWRVTKVERRFLTEDDLIFAAYQDKKAGDEYSPLIHYTLVADSAGTRRKGRANSCDAAFCQVVSRAWVEQQKRRDMEKWDAVLMLIDVLNE